MRCLTQQTVYLFSNEWSSYKLRNDNVLVQKELQRKLLSFSFYCTNTVERMTSLLPAAWIWIWIWIWEKKYLSRYIMKQRQRSIVCVTKCLFDVLKLNTNGLMGLRRAVCLQTPSTLSAIPTAVHCYYILTFIFHCVFFFFFFF